MLGTLTNEQIESVLRAELIGRIGCVSEGRAYVVPITYAYDGEAVYAHTGDGMKIRAMRATPEVCFEVEQVDNLSNWRSVIAWGVFEELHGERAGAAMHGLMERFRPLMTSESAQPSHGLAPARSPHAGDTGGRSAVLFRIVLREKTGRFEKR